mmetsp:Transcript_21917/g.32014  ORF Transcript_21917/g.32014 Transcript_21917/m.32014 type:complete len:238 (-) Transcript_21917:116-829(-)
MKDNEITALKLGRIMKFKVTTTVITVLCLTYVVIPTLWISYCDLLHEWPIFTKALTSATVYTIGDIIAQRTESMGKKDLDRPRLMRSLVAGLIGHGPLSHVWYNVSDELFQEMNLGEQLGWSTVVKVIIDQISWGPFWNNMYILLLGIMKMNPPSKIFDEIKRTTIPLLVSGFKLWPLAHCVTYGIVPVEFRLLWVDLVEISWVTILATAAAGGGVASKEKEEESRESKPLDVSRIV